MVNGFSDDYAATGREGFDQFMVIDSRSDLDFLSYFTAAKAQPRQQSLVDDSGLVDFRLSKLDSIKAYIFNPKLLG